MFIRWKKGIDMKNNLNWGITLKYKKIFRVDFKFLNR